jgi:hypothetical protein
VTLAQFLDYVRRRHNAESDTYWSDTELYQLATSRCNEVLSIIGAIEGTDTSTTTVAGTSTYSWPTGTSAVKALLYDGQLLQQITFREWEQRKAAGTTPQGQPESYVTWNRQVIIVPTPNAAKTLTYYLEKFQTYLTSSGSLEIPEELHFRMCDGVLCDMAVKDLNLGLAQFYESKWNGVHKPEFYKWRARSRRRGKYALTQDSDTDVQTDFGVS